MAAININSKTDTSEGTHVYELTSHAHISYCWQSPKWP